MDEENLEALELNDKADLIWEHGCYLDTVTHYGFKINLYSLGNKFVEAYYKVSSNEIQKIVVASDTDMKKYLSKIVYNIF